MRSNKKGDLALSTNAIVVLIIAVIILGLVITFVTQGFGAVSDKFFGQVSELPEPPAPSASRPITSSQVVVAGLGEEFGMKISVFNPGADATDVSPVIECFKPETTPDSGDVQVSPKDIASRKYVTYTYVAKLPANAFVGKNVCTITTDVIADIEGELIFEVRD